MNVLFINTWYAFINTKLWVQIENIASTLFSISASLQIKQQ